jgi:hypothetical protein
MSIIPELYLFDTRYVNYPVSIMSRAEAERKIIESDSMNTIILRMSENSVQANPDVYFVLTRMENRNRPSINIIITRNVFDETNGRLDRMIPNLIREDRLWIREGSSNYLQRE